MTTIDTNSANVLNGFAATASYIASQLPIFENVNIDGPRTTLTFDVYSQVPLDLVGRFIWVVPGPVRYNTPFLTTNHPPANGETVVITILSNGVRKYTYTFTPVFFGTASIPQNLIIAAANDVGISVANVPN
jgi:hypothetical protein